VNPRATGKDRDRERVRLSKARKFGERGLNPKARQRTVREQVQEEGVSYKLSRPMKQYQRDALRKEANKLRVNKTKQKIAESGALSLKPHETAGLSKATVRGLERVRNESQPRVVKAMQFDPKKIESLLSRVKRLGPDCDFVMPCCLAHVESVNRKTGKLTLANMRNLIRILLQRGCVETHPGPPKKDVVVVKTRRPRECTPADFCDPVPRDEEIKIEEVAWRASEKTHKVRACAACGVPVSLLGSHPLDPLHAGAIMESLKFPGAERYKKLLETASEMRMLSPPANAPEVKSAAVASCTTTSAAVVVDEAPEPPTQGPLTPDPELIQSPDEEAPSPPQQPPARLRRHHRRRQHRLRQECLPETDPLVMPY